MRIARPIINALRLSIFEGSMFGVYWNILLIIVLNGLAVALDATPLQFAILNSLPLLSQLFGLPAAKMIKERDIRKPFVLWAEAVSRSLWLLIPLVIFLPDNPSLRMWFILAVTALCNIAHSGAVIGWLSWVSDLVPEEIRGVYFGVRNAICGLVGLVGLSLASVWADGVKEKFGDGTEYMNVIFILVGISFIFSVISWIGLAYQPVRKLKNLATTGWSAIFETLTSPNGRNIAITWVAIFISTGVTTGIYMQFFLNKFHMSWLGITVYIWIVHLISVAISPLMGRLSDRYGYRNVLMWSWLGVFWQPLLSIFTPNEAHHVFGWMPAPILIDAVACGIFWPAVNLTLNNLVIAEAPSERRAGFFGALTAMGGLFGFIAAVLAGVLANHIGDEATFRFIGIPLDDLRTPLLIGAILRLLAGFLILTIKEPPREKDHVTGSQAFDAVWRVLIGKPVARDR